MKMRRSPLAVGFSILMILLLSLLCSGAFAKAKISPDEILAKVNGQDITVQRLFDHLKEKKITASSPEEDEKTKEESLNQLIREILIDQSAVSLDIESDPAFVLLRDNYMRNWLLDYMYETDIVEQVQVEDQEVKDHYEEYREVDFAIPEEVQIRDLLIRVWADSTQKDYQKKLKKAGKEAKKKIEKLHKRARRGEDFIELCREHTQAPVPNRTGDIGFVREGQHSPEFDSVAFSLKQTGDISKPFRDERGYHMLQLLDRKEKSYHQLDSTLFDRIREYLKNQKIKLATATLVDSLKKGTEFVYNEQVLESSGSPPDPDTWVLAFGEGDTVRFGDYQEGFSAYKFQIGLDSATTDDMKFFLENHLALPVILKKEAEKRGYADMMEYQAEMRGFTLEEARKKFLSGRVKKDFPTPTYEETEEYYQAHKIDFPALGVPLHVYHIVFDDSVKAAQVFDQLKQGADFTEMAKLHFPGEPEIREVAYDLGFITEGEMPEEFYQTALRMKAGEISPPVRTRWGFHLIKVLEKKEKWTTFEEIIPLIHRAIDLEKGRKHIADWEENLFDGADLWINGTLLKELALPKPEG
jgi:parvulin-like peptidyl-prolyl isomerase